MKNMSRLDLAVEIFRWTLMVAWAICAIVGIVHGSLVGDDLERYIGLAHLIMSVWAMMIIVQEYGVTNNRRRIRKLEERIAELEDDLNKHKVVFKINKTEEKKDEEK